MALHMAGLVNRGALTPEGIKAANALLSTAGAATR
jgi:hypothetical protein